MLSIPSVDKIKQYNCGHNGKQTKTGTRHRRGEFRHSGWRVVLYSIRIWNVVCIYYNIISNVLVLLIYLREIRTVVLFDQTANLIKMISHPRYKTRVIGVVNRGVVFAEVVVSAFASSLW